MPTTARRLQTCSGLKRPWKRRVNARPMRGWASWWRRARSASTQHASARGPCGTSPPRLPLPLALTVCVASSCVWIHGAVCSKEAMKHLQRQFISREEVNTRETLTRTSFWVPQVQPEAASAKLTKDANPYGNAVRLLLCGSPTPCRASSQPDKAARDPMHPDRFLRLKQLVDVNFRVDRDAKVRCR